MRIQPRHRLLGIFLSVALGMAMLFSAFAHKPPAVTDAAMASYVLAGGDLADLCDADGSAKMKQSGCDACRQVGAAVLPDPLILIVALERVVAAAVLIPAEVRSTRAPRDPALGERAPPTV